MYHRVDGILEIRGSCRLIFCCSLAVFIIVDTCHVGYILLCCEDDMFVVQRGSWNA